MQQSNSVQRVKKSNSQTIVVLTGDAVIDDGNVVIEQEVEEESVKHSTPVVRGRRQDLTEAANQSVSSRPTRATAAAKADEQEQGPEVEMEDEEHGEGDQEVTTKTRGRATRTSVKAVEADDHDGAEDGSSPTRKSTRARK